MRANASALAGVLALGLLPGVVDQGLRAAGDEPLRPRLHFTPPRNFMNDPNGLVLLDGEYHLFYQYNPEGDQWGHMSWGHAVSRDLLRWRHLPLALREEDGIMVFSGSAVVDEDNTSGLCEGAPPRSCLVAVYTGHGHGKQTQNLAVSLDRGRTWTKYAGNPVLDLHRDDNRDPKVFWYAPARRWIMVSVLAGERKVRLFSSSDLKGWERLSDFGPAGATGGAWECPDLFPLPVDGNPDDVKWVLKVDLNPGGRVGGSGAQYFVGAFDGRTFLSDNPPERTLWVDYGKDFYASQSYAHLPLSQGRRLWIGWMSNWLYADVAPTSPWRGVQSLPRELGLRRTPDGIRLVQSPLRELQSLRVGAEPRSVSGETALPPSAEIALEVVAGDWTEAGLRIRNDAGEEAVVGVSAQPLEVFVDRRRSRATPFHEGYPERHAGPVRWRDGRVGLHVVFDRTTLEVFANEGEIVISDRLYPTRPLDRLESLHRGRGLSSPLRLWELTASEGTRPPFKVEGAGREGVRDRWWETTAAIVRVHPRGKTPFPIKDVSRLEPALDDLLAQGITAVEVFAPAEGGRSFGGLDTIDRYRLEPAAGTMDDFRNLVRRAHARGMAIISFDNLGYSSVEAIDFLKAADDVREGRASREASFFIWSDSADAPPPSEGADQVFFVRPTHLPGATPGSFYDSSKHEYWEWSERARKFYWTKWGGEDRQGRKVRLPQYDWRSPAFQEEAERVVRFWMDTGIDGMVIDAVNWYVGCTWEMSRRRMTDVIKSYGNAYAQPEGAGAFREDPVAWITEGGWNSVQDYGLGIWWEDGTNVIRKSIETGDPRPLEAALRSYHDRVVEAGGSLYFQPTGFDDDARWHLALATLTSLGSLIQVEDWPNEPADAERCWLLKTKASHSALHQCSTRRHIPTLADDKHYAFLRTAPGGVERLLVVLNFQREAQEVGVDLSGLAASALVDLRTGERFAREPILRLPLAGFGYRFLLVTQGA
jgi:sucrose-6-phosphate hydrolase SacC (GH32 family)